MTVDLGALARTPSPESWRLLCEALAALPEDRAMKEIGRITADLDAWPDELRATMCGMNWDDRFFAGDPDPRSVIVRHLRFDRIFSGRYGGMMIRSPTLQGTSLRGLSTTDGVRRLTMLDLGYHPIGREGARALASSPHFERLAYLRLNGCDLDGEALRAMSHAPFFSKLRELDIGNNGLAGAAIAPLFEGDPTPVELRLGSNPLGPGGAAAIARNTFASTKELHLHSCELGEQGAAALSRYAPPLDNLAIGGNTIGDDGLVALASGSLRANVLSIDGDAISVRGVRALLEARWPLRYLSLSKNALGDEAAKLLSATGPSSLEGLDLDDNDVTAAGMSAIVASEALSGLRTLRLGTNRIGSVSELAPTMQRLESLDLRDNRLGDDGARALLHVRADHLTNLNVARNGISAPAIEELSGAPWFGGLGVLDVSGNPIGAAGGVVLGARMLSDLDLSRTGLGDKGLEALCRAELRPTRLALDGCDITDRGVEILAGSRIVSRLETLSLTNNAITNRGAEALARSPHLKAITRLFLGDNRIGDEGVLALTQWQGPMQIDLDGNPYGKRGQDAIAALPRRCCP